MITKKKNKPIAFRPFFLLLSPCCKEFLSREVMRDSGYSWPESSDSPFSHSFGNLPQECNCLVIVGSLSQKWEEEFKVLVSQIRPPKKIILFGDCAIGKTLGIWNSLNLKQVFENCDEIPGHLGGGAEKESSQTFELLQKALERTV